MDDRPTARRMHRTLEPYHGMIYFAPEATESYRALGCDDPRTGYFASRAAAMGAVGPATVLAAFYNFAPDVVDRAMADAWALAPPARWSRARLAGADAALRRMLSDAVDAAEMAEAAALARRAAEVCAPQGRVLAAAHLALPWPSEPHLALWHALTILREHRGDGHVAALVLAGIGPVEALVTHEAVGAVPPGLLQATRGWSDEDWQRASASLIARGWLDQDGALTDAGAAAREAVEDETDRAAAAPWAALTADEADRLRTLVRPWSRAIVAAGTFGAAP